MKGHQYIKSLFFDITSMWMPHICPLCLTHEAKDNSPFCLPCDARISHITDLKDAQAIFESKNLDFSGTKIISLFHFYKDTLGQELLHLIKYGGKKKLAQQMGMQLADLRQSHFEKHTTLIPVPIHPLRRKERGYNQAEEIAKGINKRLGLAYRDDVILRTVHLKSQTKKSRQERYQLLSDAFRVDSADIDADHFTLVDDILTTGATTKACMSALQSSFPQNTIDLATLAIAM